MSFADFMRRQRSAKMQTSVIDNDLEFVFFLVYRSTIYSPKQIDWQHPNGGLVMYRRDAGYARDVAALRYHADPGEELIIAEVWEKTDRDLARLLHEIWEQQAAEFEEWMSSPAADPHD